MTPIGRAGAATGLVVALAVGGCATPSSEVASGSWTELPAPPIPARQNAVPAWTGTEALFLGGDTGPPCLDTSDCAVPPAARDGAAFDPVAGTWRRTAEAPVPIPAVAPAVISDTVYLMTVDGLLSYDASDDAWVRHPPPAVQVEWRGLATVGERLVAFRGERRAGDPPDQVYDPATRTWAPLPEDPLGPAFDRALTATSAGLVLTGHELVPDPGATEPSLVRAAVLDVESMRWTLLEDSDQAGGWRWAWTGRRMVDPTPGGVDGGATGNYGRTVPLGGVLDPASGTWGRLPGDVPAERSGGWPVEALGGPLSAVEGWIYDDRAETWTLLPVPAGAPPTPGSGVWAGERLVVLGGVDPARGMTVDALSDGAWMWSPPSAGPDEAPVAVSEADLAGTWALQEGTAGGEPIAVPEQARATLEFAEAHQVRGTAFCNGYSGTYRLEGEDLQLEDVGMTLIGCSAAVSAAESAYLDALLGGGLRVAVDGGRLVLTGDRGTLSFYRLPPVPTRELVGTRWLLETVAAGGTASSAVGEPAVLEFRYDGTATVSTGCREFEAAWRASGDSVVLGDYAYDDVGCVEPVGRQDRLVLEVLGGGFQVAVDGDVLTVSDVDAIGAERPVLTYRAEG